MFSLKELCRQVLTKPLSNRQLALAFRVSGTTVARYRQRLQEEGIDEAGLAALDEQALDYRLNTGRRLNKKAFVEPDWNHVYKELLRVGVTLGLLHEEYAGGLDDGAMSETEFRRRYHCYRKSRGLVMRQEHRPGEMLYLDYSGKRPSLTDPKIGERAPVELLVGVMGASRKTYVLATHSQKLPDWTFGNVQALQFFGGVPQFLVPDQLKSAVTKYSRSDGPLINPTYAECARHYNTMILPARPRKPKDKAAVELGVLIAQRWILARLRNRVFYTLEELNAAIRELTQKLNDKPMKSVGGKSRNQLFDELDAPALKPLPVETYEFGEWKLNVKVGQDYHVAWEGHYYSVPYTLVGSTLSLKIARDTVTAFKGGHRMALHVRSYEAVGTTTLPEHRPQSHQAYAEEQPAQLLAWAERNGGAIHSFVQRHVELKRSPMLTVQLCQGLQRLAREFTLDRLQAACERSLHIHAYTITSVRSQLQRNLERQPVQNVDAANDDTPPVHDNIRGSSYYS